MMEIVLEGTIGIRGVDAHVARIEAAIGSEPVAIRCAPDLDGDVTLLQLIAAARASASQAGGALHLLYDGGTPFERLLQDAGFAPSLPSDGEQPYDSFWAGEAINK